MNAPHTNIERRSACLASRISQAGGEGRWLWDGVREVSVASAISETRLGGSAGRTGRQDGADPHHGPAVRRAASDRARQRGPTPLIIAPPDLDEAHLPFVIEDGGVDAIVGDIPPSDDLKIEHVRLVGPSPRMRSSIAHRRSEWVMFTSGTTGRPKMVVHSLHGLTGAIPPVDADDPPVWGHLL